MSYPLILLIISVRACKNGLLLYFKGSVWSGWFCKTDSLTFQSVNLLLELLDRSLSELGSGLSLDKDGAM